MIGLKALPPHYGGFETAADEISRRLVELGHEVVVYNRTGLTTYVGDDYHGVKLVTLPTINTKNLSAIVHSLVCSVHLLFNRVDVVHYFTTGSTHNQASVSLLDRDLTVRLNKELGIDFRMPDAK